MNNTTKSELENNVRSIANDLEAIARGELYKDENGEYTTEATYTDEDGDEKEREPVNVHDYIYQEALSIENWKINISGECVGGTIQFCWGGPNVWATEDGVFGAWGGERFDWESSEAGNVIREYLEETMPTK